jgi:RND family efflux transporter MFP subunit
VRTDSLRFRAGVPERAAAQVRVGEPLTIALEGAAEPLTVTVSRISPALDLTNRTLMLEADVPNPEGRLHAGLFAEGDIVVDPKAQTLAVPATAVTEFAGVEKVYLVQGGKAEERRVLTGRRQLEWVEILGGLSAGDAVITDAGQGRIGPVTAE